MASSGIATVSTDWRSSFFDGLTLQDRKRILAAAKPRRFAANSLITNQGNAADYLFLLTKDRARYFFDERGGTGCGPPCASMKCGCTRNDAIPVHRVILSSDLTLKIFP